MRCFKKHVPWLLGPTQFSAPRAPDGESGAGGRLPSPQDRAFQVHRRFYNALALLDVVQERPFESIARKFGVARGALQVQRSAAQRSAAQRSAA
jgi:hypothetical protein